MGLRIMLSSALDERRHQVPTLVAAAAENLYRVARVAGLAAEDDSVLAVFLSDEIQTQS